MKKLLILLTFAAGMALPAQAQDKENEGIRFFHGTWDEALQEAREQGKMLFVDIWASWCGPCKRMAATTFMEKEAGDYFNAHFVNYKLLTDPEDKAERKQARELAQKYHANFLPTLVWVDGDGNLLHFATGYHEVAELIAEAKRAQDPARRVGTILQRWADGDRSLEAGMAYFSAFPDASAEFDAFYLGLPPEQQVFSPLKCLTLERSAKRRRTKTTAIMMISTNLFASSFPYPLAYLQAERVYPCPNKIQDYEDSGEVEHRGPAFTHFSPPWPSL